jgi:hypothetical protein
VFRKIECFIKYNSQVFKDDALSIEQQLQEIDLQLQLSSWNFITSCTRGCVAVVLWKHKNQDDGIKKRKV